MLSAVTGIGPMSLDGKPQTYRVVGVNADGTRVTLVRSMLKETAEAVARVLVIGQVYERADIEPEDDERTAQQGQAGEVLGRSY